MPFQIELSVPPRKVSGFFFRQAEKITDEPLRDFGYTSAVAGPTGKLEMMPAWSAAAISFSERKKPMIAAILLAEISGSEQKLRG